MEYVIILIDSKVMAKKLNANLTGLPLRYVYSGERILGLHFRGQRPSCILDCINYRDEQFYDWFNHILLPMTHHAKKYERVVC